MRRSLAAAVLALGMVLGMGVLMTDVQAGIRLPAAPPAGIAIIDIEKVFTGLAETADMRTQLDMEVAKMNADIKDMKEKVENQRKSADMLAPGKDREEAMQKAVEMDMNEQVKERFFAVMIDRKRANMYRVINDRIIDGCKRLAQKNGYTMVISSDDQVRLTEKANSDDAQRIMSLKRFLYVAPEHDVTADLIKMLNDEHAKR